MEPKSDPELREIKLDIALADNQFDKWFKEEEILNGVMN